jgi:membrane-associated phospholipid phosphatase
VKEILVKNRPFLVPYAIFLVTGIVFFLAFTKPELHLFLNGFHRRPLDILFEYITWLGEWPPFLLIPILLFFRYRYALMCLFGNLLSFGIAQLLKYTLFSDALRPVAYFEPLQRKLPLVEGVQNLFYNSFPSGHTTCAFATFFCLALITTNALNKFLFFMIALAVGFSRVYLSQHFFDDIYAGSLLGFTSMFTVYLLLQRSRRPWLDKRLGGTNQTN